MPSNLSPEAASPVAVARNPNFPAAWETLQRELREVLAEAHFPTVGANDPHALPYAYAIKIRSAMFILERMLLPLEPKS